MCRSSSPGYSATICQSPSAMRLSRKVTCAFAIRPYAGLSGKRQGAADTIILELGDCEETIALAMAPRKLCRSQTWDSLRAKAQYYGVSQNWIEDHTDG